MKTNTNIRQVSEIKISYKPKVKTKDRYYIHNSKDAYDLLMKDAFREETIEYKEYMKVILLNKANGVLGIYPLSEGGMDTVIIDVRLILQIALLTHSAAFILAHNHTSGQLQPSMQDNVSTEKVREAAKLLNIVLHDHLIVSENGYYSYADEGRL